MIREAFGAEFVGSSGYLDTPTYGLPPRFVADALRDCMRSWERGTLEMSAFDEPAHASRAAYASLVGVDESRVVLGTSVSSLIGLVAASIPDGRRVATLRGELTSATFPFAVQAGRGVTVTELPPGELENTAGDFDVVAASLVQSADGAVLDIDTLHRSVVGSDTVTVIDATHALGWKQVDLAWADSVVAHGYKWLLAPRGAAWMSLRSGDEITSFSASNLYDLWYGRGSGDVGTPLWAVAAASDRVAAAPVARCGGCPARAGRGGHCCAGDRGGRGHRASGPGRDREQRGHRTRALAKARRRARTRRAPRR